jgi:hypothetical protein
MERAFHINRINKQFPWIHAGNKQFPWNALDYIRSHAEKSDSFIRELSFRAVAVEDATDSQIRTNSVTVEEKTLIVQ